MHPNQKRLITFLWVYEVSIILVCAFGALLIALSGGGSIIFAVPVLLVAIAEMLRVPLAGWLLKAKLPAKMMGFCVLVVISIISFEGLSLVFEMSIQNRIANVTAAQKEFDAAKAALLAKTTLQKQAQAKTDAVTAEVAALDNKIAELVRHQPTAPGFSGKTCGKNNSTCTADRAAQATYDRARRDFEKGRQELEVARKTARQNAERLENSASQITTINETVTLKNTHDALVERRMDSPMHRLSAAWFGVTAGDMTDNQFQVVKRFIVFSLAAAFSTMSALISLVAFSEPAGAKDDKVARAWRGFLARLRKRVVKKVRVEVPGPETVRIKYVPVPDDGRVRRALGQYESVGERLTAFKEML